MQVFTNYCCRSLDRGKPHPGDIAEPSSLSAIPLPRSDYPLWDALPSSIVEAGKLSSLQLEGVLYACSRHLEILPSNERAGFFIGDGAGVGKGRQISGIILDNYVRGRRCGPGGAQLSAPTLGIPPSPRSFLYKAAGSLKFAL